MEKPPSALILFSGGIDSTTLLYYVIKKLGYSRVVALGVNYEQSNRIELKFAEQIAKELKIPFDIIEINLRQYGGSPLTSDEEVPDAKEDKQYMTNVPVRNAIFLANATAYAEKHGLKDIFFGPCAEDFKSYPDCRPEFVYLSSINLAKISNINGIYAPFLHLNKKEIVKLGRELGVNFDKTYSCYRGGEEPCLRCNACLERQEALK